MLLVVKVRQRGVDLREVVAHPAIRAFEHVAISNVHPGGATEDLRALLTLTGDVRERAEERYDELAERIALLRPDGWRLITDFVQTLQSPIDVLETANALIEVQLEGNPHDEQRSLILRRVLIRLLEWRSAGEFCALIGLATRGEEAAKRLLGEADATVLLGGLKAQGLLRDGQLRQWASFLEREELRAGLFETEARLPTEGHLTEAWADRVRESVGWAGKGRMLADTSNISMPTKVFGVVITDLLENAVESALEGQLSRAREILTLVESTIDGNVLPPNIGAMYWAARAQLKLREGLLEEAELLSREAMRYVDVASVSYWIRIVIRRILSRALHGQGKHGEAAKVEYESERLERRRE